MAGYDWANGYKHLDWKQVLAKS